MKTCFRLQTMVIFALLLCSFLALGSNAQTRQSRPTISFVSPPDTAYVFGDLTISVSVTNFKLVENNNRPATSGEGQLVYSLDGEIATNSDTGAAAWAIPVTQAITGSQNYTFHNVTPGAHSVSVKLVNNDLTSLAPSVTAWMTVVLSQLPVTSGSTNDLTTSKRQTVDPIQPVIRQETGLIIL